MKWKKTVTLAITGASGAQYGLRLLQCLVATECRVYLLISRAAEVVIATETTHKLPQDNAAMGAYLADFAEAKTGQVQLYSREDWFAPVASGSSAPASMVICPASGGTLSAIATGASNNLIERAADVALKERRQLIVVPRETPYSEIHLENMLKITRMGGIVLPASPGFYQSPVSVESLIDFIVARIMDHLGVPQDLFSKWGE
ncbi:MAG: 4-hydroxy-3-polyprenylbenzoate decarboxylase [Lentisphaeria bacterium]|jgi:4-hydroxy-3-polyprenylbenzoate decarboxylase